MPSSRAFVTMKSRIFCLVFLLHLVVLTSTSEVESQPAAVHPHPRRHRHHRQVELQNDQSNSIPGGLTESEQKILLDCQNSDYRTYIKCLKREKRQHHGLEKRACLDECFETNCTTSACIRDCHTNCRKRVIETHTKTVETSYDCSDGSCSERSGSNVPNISTTVHITNIMPNTTCNEGKDGKDGAGGSGGSGGGSGSSGEGGRGGSGTQGGSGGSGGKGGPGGSGSSGGDGTGGDGSNGKAGVIPKIELNNIINNQLGPGFGQYPGSDCACPGCNCYGYNPWQAMPQITIGFGGGPIGGCMYPMPWPCFQKNSNPPATDCSACSNPFLRYQCNPMCVQGKNATQTTTTQKPFTSATWTSNTSRRY